MEERRRAKRTELQCTLLMKRLDEQTAEVVTIAITDVSKSGLGFESTVPLTIGAVYECHLTIWTQEILHVFLEIVRIEKNQDGFLYGALFVGMSEMDAARIAVYQTVEENAK